MRDESCTFSKCSEAGFHFSREFPDFAAQELSPAFLILPKLLPLCLCRWIGRVFHLVENGFPITLAESGVICIKHEARWWRLTQSLNHHCLNSLPEFLGSLTPCGNASGLRWCFIWRSHVSSCLIAASGQGQGTGALQRIKALDAGGESVTLWIVRHESAVDAGRGHPG